MQAPSSPSSSSGSNLGQPSYPTVGRHMMCCDCWKAYDVLHQEGYEHLKVNHSITFKDPETGAHTNSIESSWRAAKSSMKTSGTCTWQLGRIKAHVPGNLASEPWRTLIEIRAMSCSKTSPPSGDGFLEIKAGQIRGSIKIQRSVKNSVKIHVRGCVNSHGFGTLGLFAGILTVKECLNYIKEVCSHL
ncbi:ISXO2-like transposase domain [Popillia japonica]|uniref:ISXO2-like transposase domain n=1 Tax=Popillia japonica TaxID=7064 RepID=A0AAW1K248_POPJA